MITTDPQQWLELFREGPTLPLSPLRAALLVGPEGFRISSQSAADNTYMRLEDQVDLDLAGQQHAGVASKLKELGIKVQRFPGVPGQDDGMFPNNVFATARNRYIVGKMYHPVRQQEANREDIRSFFSRDLGYQPLELAAQPSTCELTGSLIIDHSRAVAVCGLSKRCEANGARLMDEAFGLRATLSTPLVTEEYHTNVVLSILAGRGCVIYPEAFADERAAAAIIEAYGDGAIVLTQTEKNHFAANCLAVSKNDILLSKNAFDHLQPATCERFSKLGFALHPIDISELEKGGGSLRCLIAEIF